MCLTKVDYITVCPAVFVFVGRSKLKNMKKMTDEEIDNLFKEEFCLFDFATYQVLPVLLLVVTILLSLVTIGWLGYLIWLLLCLL